MHERPIKKTGRYISVAQCSSPTFQSSSLVPRSSQIIQSHIPEFHVPVENPVQRLERPHFYTNISVNNMKDAISIHHYYSTNAIHGWNLTAGGKPQSSGVYNNNFYSSSMKCSFSNFCYSRSNLSALCEGSSSYKCCAYNTCSLLLWTIHCTIARSKVDDIV